MCLLMYRYVAVVLLCANYCWLIPANWVRVAWLLRSARATCSVGDTPSSDGGIGITCSVSGASALKINRLDQHGCRTASEACRPEPAARIMSEVSAQLQRDAFCIWPTIWWVGSLNTAAGDDLVPLDMWDNTLAAAHTRAAARP